MSATRLIAVDSSVGVKWINSQEEKHVNLANRILQHAQENKFTIIMPELSKYEIANALLYKKLEFSLLQTSLEDFYHLPIRFIPENQRLAFQSVEIAVFYNITYYDASFLALAKEYKAKLITDNPKHQDKKISGLNVVSLKDYR